MSLTQWMITLRSSRFSWLLNPAMVLDRWRSLLRFLKSPIDSVAFHFLRFFFSHSNSPAGPTVLLLRIDGIGDFIFFAKYLEQIRRAYRDFRIVLVCRREVSELAHQVDGIDEVIGLNAKKYQWNYLYRLRFLRRIRSRGAQTTMYLSFHRRHIGDEIALLSGARTVIAFSGNDEIMRRSTMKRNNRYYSTVVQTPDHVPEREKYRILFDALGIKPPDEPEPVVRLRVQETSRVDDSPSAIIAPGSTSIMRQWPAERFAAVADLTTERYGFQIILCGDRKQKTLLRKVSRLMKHRSRIVDNLSLAGILALLRASRLFVGNDSGLLHLAATLNVPAVGIIGGGHFSRYFPYGTMEVVFNPLECFECNWKCRYRKAYCVADIPAESVMTAVEKILDLPQSVDRRSQVSV